MKSRALVWFKRDLRIHDHAALAAAQTHSEALGLFVIEPEWLQSPECDASHVEFALGCLAELRAALAERGLPLLVRVGKAVEVLSQLHSELAFTHLLSHEETGSGWSYTRDLQVAAWSKSASVVWQISVQRMANCLIGLDYSLPIVDDRAAMKAAKERMYGLRKTQEARQEADDVQARHGSRKSGLPPSGQGRKAAPKQVSKRTNKEPSTPSPQGDLFA